MPKSISQIENTAPKYTECNVEQCWKCKNKGADAVFKAIGNFTVEYVRLPECVLHHCYITELDSAKCSDFCAKD